MEGQHSLDRLEILGIGALNVDYLFKVDQFVIDGETSIEEFYRSAGGSAANTILILSQLGVRAGVFGVVGTDPDGEFIENTLQRKKVASFIQKINGPTGRAYIFVDSSGRRSIYVLPGVNLELENIKYPDVYNFEWVHATSLVGEKPAMKQLSWLMSLPQEIKISFSPGMLYSKLGLTKSVEKVTVLKTILRRSYIVFLNREELSLLMGVKGMTATEIKSSLKELHKMGPEFIAVTLGKDGAILSSADEFLHEPSLAEKVVDTTGAGDAFAAGVLYGMIRGLNVKDSLISGQKFAAQAVQVWGTVTFTTKLEIPD